MDDVIGADEIGVSFKDIGGLENELEEVRDNIVLPFQIYKNYKQFESIASCPTGVLLLLYTILYTTYNRYYYLVFLVPVRHL